MLQMNDYTNLILMSLYVLKITISLQCRRSDYPLVQRKPIQRIGKVRILRQEDKSVPSTDFERVNDK